MNRTLARILSIGLISAAVTASLHGEDPRDETWTQWRGPSRDGMTNAASWPASLDEQRWRPGDGRCKFPA